MHVINLEIADNGIIKIVKDDNINGANKSLEKKILYILNKDDNEYFNIIKEFTEDLLEDVGIFTGNIYNKDTLQINRDWGEKYTPSKEEAKAKIKALREQIKELKQYI